MSVETVLETIVVSQIVREAGAPETVVEQLVRTEVVTETSGRPGKPGVSVVDVVATQASGGTVTLTFTMSDGETHVVTFQAGTGGVVEPPAAVTLAGAGTARAEALAVLRAALDLSGIAAGFSAVTATASLSSWITLAASAEARAAAAGTIAASLPLAGTAPGRGMAAGEPAFRIDLAAVGEGSSAASASLTAALGLAGSATARGVAAAQVALALQCAGAAVARAQASGFLTLGNDLALQASVTARATASGMFALDVSIAGTAAGRALASGSVAAARDVAGAATGRAQATGTVAAARALAGSASGVAAASGTISAAAPAFYVLALGPAMWIDAADAASLSVVDGKVSQASDKSGNGRHAVQATATRQPSYAASHPVANNKPAIFAEAANTQVILTTDTAFAVAEWYIVAAYMTGTEATSGNFQALIGGSGTSGQPRLLTSSGTANWITSNAMANGSVSKNGAAESIVTLPMPLSLVRAVDTAGNAASNYRRFLLNQADGQSRSWPGPVCEIIGFQTALATSDREALIAHLKGKWGLVF